MTPKLTQNLSKYRINIIASISIVSFMFLPSPPGLFYPLFGNFHEQNRSQLIVTSSAQCHRKLSRGARKEGIVDKQRTCVNRSLQYSRISYDENLIVVDCEV